MLDGKPHSYAVDWYAFGLLVWELLAGLPPFAAQTGNVSDVYDAIRRGPPPFPRHFSEGVRALLTDLLQMDPTLRLGARPADADVEAIKTHSFFATVDWELVLAKKVVPPWIPPSRELTDTSNFDAEFTSLPIVGSVDTAHGVTGVSHTSGKSIASGASLPQFEGFSYGSMGSCLGTSVPGMSPALPSSIMAGSLL
jgi:serine/threonine protein kinase